MTLLGRTELLGFEKNLRNKAFATFVDFVPFVDFVSLLGRV